MSKQTAAKWLYVKMFEKEGRITKEEYEQALQMEKQQIIDAYNQGEFNQGCNGSAEQYYKETYEQ